MVTVPIEVGVDYLTATLSYEEGFMFYTIVRNIKKLPLFEECEERPWAFYGYRGFILIAGQSGHLAYGDHNYNGHIIQLSGEFALRYWLQFVNVATNVSRIDIRVDANCIPPDPDLALVYYNEVVKANLTKRRYSIVMTKDGGETLYVGARASDMFGRVYDKSAEEGSGALGAKWRYEVEYKKQRARALAGELAARANIQPVEQFAVDMGATVYDWFDKRDVPPIFSRKGRAIVGLSASINASMGKMRWLRSQVSPSVKSLVVRGKGAEVVEALGLDDFYDFTWKGPLHTGMD